MSQEGSEPTFYVHDAVYLWAIVRFTCWSLYDAVYLYLLTVNQTLSEDSYKDGRLIRNQTVGQRFTGKPSFKHTKAYSPVVVAKLETYIYTNKRYTQFMHKKTIAR